MRHQWHELPTQRLVSLCRRLDHHGSQPPRPAAQAAAAALAASMSGSWQPTRHGWKQRGDTWACTNTRCPGVNESWRPRCQRCRRHWTADEVSQSPKPKKESRARSQSADSRTSSKASGASGVSELKAQMQELQQKLKEVTGDGARQERRRSSRSAADVPPTQERAQEAASSEEDSEEKLPQDQEAIRTALIADRDDVKSMLQVVTGRDPNCTRAVSLRQELESQIEQMVPVRKLEKNCGVNQAHSLFGAPHMNWPES